MLLIFLSWIYILFTTINLGVVLDKIIKTKSNNLVLISFFGLFFTTILASIWAIFSRINIEFAAFILFLNSVIFFINKSRIIGLYKHHFNKIKSLHYVLKLYLTTITILIIAQCATAPYLVDNETYYIQTIKWLNEYGLVKGLANLHIFFAQISGWHITQSVFSFSFLYSNFNDLSGFCLLLGNVFAILKLNNYFNYGGIHNLYIGLFPLLNILFFRFISTPSPDIPVYVMSSIIFYYFIKNNKKIGTVKLFNTFLILTLFVFYIKSTAAILLLIPIYYLQSNFKFYIKNNYTLFISIVTIFLFVLKNTIISGYPFYPLHFLKIYDFALPTEILTFFTKEKRIDGFHLSIQEFNNLSVFQIAKKWLFSSLIDSIFYISSLLMLVLTPFFIKKYRNQSLWIIYFLMIIQIALMLLTSPQYRFFFQFILFFGLLFISYLFYNKRRILFALYLSLVVIFILLFVPVNYKALTNNKLLQQNNTFLSENILFPNQNSKYKNEFTLYKIGNLKYYSPSRSTFLWTTANGNLPCINKEQIIYFEKNLHYIPQLRTNNLKDGFYSKQVIPNE
jgi:hypothetical protein